jgi:hypothetical protein
MPMPFPAMAPEMPVDISYDYWTNSASAYIDATLHLGVYKVSYLFPKRRRSMTQTND